MKPVKRPDPVTSALKPFAVQFRPLDLGLSALLEPVDRSREWLRVSLGPVEDLRQSGLLDAEAQITSASRSVVESVTQQLESLPQIHEAIQAAVALPSIELPKVANDIVGGMNLLGSAVAELESRFSLPDAAEVTSLLGSPYVLPSAEGIALSPELMPELQRSLSMVTVPWLDVEDKARSISGLCDLQYLGYVLSTSPPFDLDVSDRLRQSLGDWREEIDWPSSIFTDPLARSDFYRERGLDPALTDFPAPAFYEGTRIAGLKLDLPPLVPEYHPESDREEEETGFVRTNAAHDRLLRFETQLRRFIDKAMRAEFGDGWIKRQVSEDIRNGWHRKQQRDQEDGIRDHPLIAYAEFTHYEQIITQKDNWQRVFAPTFRRQTLVQESLQRLYPIRRCTMHARIITQDDELYLYTETKRLLAVMGISI